MKQTEEKNVNYRRRYTLKRRGLFVRLTSVLTSMVFMIVTLWSLPTIYMFGHNEPSSNADSGYAIYPKMPPNYLAKALATYIETPEQNVKTTIITTQNSVEQQTTTVEKTKTTTSTVTIKTSTSSSITNGTTTTNSTTTAISETTSITKTTKKSLSKNDKTEVKQKEVEKQNVSDEKVEKKEPLSKKDSIKDVSDKEDKKDSVNNQNSSKTDYEWNGQKLTAFLGVVQGPSGKESYYNYDMSTVVKYMKDLGYDYEYWVREDGVKMYGDYVMCAANLEIRPKGTLVQTSLGMGIVCDTGGFAYQNTYQLDIAVAW